MTPRILAAIFTGVALVLSLAPYRLWPLAFVAFVPLLLSIEGQGARRRFFLAYLAGIVFFVGSVYWVVHSMHYYGGLGFSESVPVMVLLAAYLALFFAFFGLLAFALPRAPIAVLLYIPALWVGLEYLRGHLFTGFPWVLSGYALAGNFVLSQAADIAGVWALSFAVMLVNAAIYLVLSSGMRRRPWPLGAIILAALIMTAMVAYGVVRPMQVDRALGTWPKVRVSAAQGNIDQAVKWDKKSRSRTLDVYSRLTRAAAARGARLVVWPETAVPFYLEHYEAGRERLFSIARRSGLTILTGSPAYDYNKRTGRRRYYNSAYVISRKGRLAGRYDKVHLVPYGEYVPLKRYMPFIKKLTVGTGDFTAGPGPSPINVNGFRAGVLICYEAIFPSLARASVRAGAGILVNITNDAWFGRTAAPYQHLEMARLRAVENRVYMIRAANTGVSAIIDPAGRILKKTTLFKEDVITADVRTRKGPATLYTRYGDFLAYASLVFTGLVMILGRKKAGT
jgi:apolipoprotein N-acyltransferase